jgi:hypothetical protein
MLLVIAPQKVGGTNRKKWVAPIELAPIELHRSFWGGRCSGDWGRSASRCGRYLRRLGCCAFGGRVVQLSLVAEAPYSAQALNGCGALVSLVCLGLPVFSCLRRFS